jgi:hypothetical protein
MTINFRSLRYEYDEKTGKCLFEDGTCYTVREMLYIAKHDLDPRDESAIHMVKKMIDGEIDTSRVLPHIGDWLDHMSRSFPRARRARVPDTEVEPLEQSELDL